MRRSLLHINSYYADRRFYSNLYDRQNGLFERFQVFVPICKDASVAAPERPYLLFSECYAEADRWLFLKKERGIYATLKNNTTIGDYDITHAHSLFANGYVSWLLKQEFGIPYVVAVRGTDIDIFFKWRINLRNIGRRILRDAGVVVFLSPVSRDRVLSTYLSKEDSSAVISKTVVIPNGIDRYWLDNVDISSRREPLEEIRILCVGVICRNKNMLKLAKACDLLRAKGANIRLRIVGRKEDPSLVEQLGRLDFVELFDPMPKEVLRDQYRWATLFALVSKRETLGLVYAEALSQGLPIIYSKGQGFDGQFPDGHVGYPVDSGSLESIAAGIERVVAEGDEVARNAPSAARRFDWDEIAKSYSEMYERCLFS